MINLKVKPKHLKSKSLIGLIAPSFQFNESLFQEGVKKIESWGFRVIYGKNIHKRHYYFAGTPEERAQDINTLFSNKEVECIWCARAGSGAASLLPYLNNQLIKRNPKLFVGFSDVTLLHTYFNQTFNWVTLHGPMVGTEQFLNLIDTDTTSLISVLTEPKPLAPFTVKTLRTINPGHISGKTVGGNLSVLTSTLGTPYSLNNKSGVLFLEDTAEPHYKIERMMTQLIDSGALKHIKGIFLGSFDKIPKQAPFATPQTSVDNIFKRLFKHKSIPIYAGFPSGHYNRNMIVPMNIKISIHNKTITFLESATQ